MHVLLVLSSLVTHVLHQLSAQVSRLFTLNEFRAMTPTKRQKLSTAATDDDWHVVVDDDLPDSKSTAIVVDAQSFDALKPLIFTSRNFHDFSRLTKACLLYTSPSPRDGLLSRMPSSA